MHYVSDHRWISVVLVLFEQRIWLWQTIYDKCMITIVSLIKKSWLSNKVDLKMMKLHYILKHGNYGLQIIRRRILKEQFWGMIYISVIERFLVNASWVWFIIFSRSLIMYPNISYILMLNVQKKFVP